MSEPERGEVWWCELPDISGRPVLVLSRDISIRLRRRAVVAPCTTNIRSLDTEVLLEPGEDPVPQLSAVNLDAVLDVSVAELTRRMGRVGDDTMRQVCRALAVAVDCRM